jgi:Ser/Thr protein kinase RdoA (MazF antagonist)
VSELDIARRVMARLAQDRELALELEHGFGQGETRTAHLVRDTDGRPWVLKWSPASPESDGNLRRLVTLVDGLRAVGYPAPQHLAVGVVDEVAFWIHEYLPGTPLQSLEREVPDDAVLVPIVPRLVELVDLHADRGDLVDPPWPTWLVDTLLVGGDGYCLHDTMGRRPETAQMLHEIKGIGAGFDDGAAARVRRHDIVHFDFSYANVLADGGTVTGVIDWSVPFAGALQGDRSFDLATLLFYSSDRPATRDLLWAALLDRCAPPSAALYLAHLTLRQVEWVERFYPGTREHDRFLAIGRRILDDVGVMLAE